MKCFFFYLKSHLTGYDSFGKPVINKKTFDLTTALGGSSVYNLSARVCFIFSEILKLFFYNSLFFTEIAQLNARAYGHIKRSISYRQ